MFDEDEIVAEIDKHLAHESLVKSRRDAFHIVGNDKEISTSAGGIKPQVAGRLEALSRSKSA
jgi:hypothetical protein